MPFISRLCPRRQCAGHGGASAGRRCPQMCSWSLSGWVLSSRRRPDASCSQSRTWRQCSTISETRATYRRRPPPLLLPLLPHPPPPPPPPPPGTWTRQRGKTGRKDKWRRGVRKGCQRQLKWTCNRTGTAPRLLLPQKLLQLLLRQRNAAAASPTLRRWRISTIF